MKGKPVDLQFNIEGKGGFTRASDLSQSVNVYVTADAGDTWCKYVYSNSDKLWKPATGETPIIWQEKEITLFAIVRYDGKGITDETVSVNANQTTYSNFANSDFLGCRETFTYNSGKITLTLKHRVAKLRVVAYNCPTENANQLLTCTTAAAFATAGTYSLGYSNVELTAGETPTSTIQLYREKKEGNTVYFAAYLFPIPGNTTTNLTFTLNGKTGTTTVAYNLTSGITLDSGCITQYEVFLPAQ